MCVRVIMKTMYSLGYHHNGFMTTLVQVHECMNCHKAIVVITERVHCFYGYTYITLILLLLDLSTICVVDRL